MTKLLHKIGLIAALTLVAMSGRPVAVKASMPPVCTVDQDLCPDPLVNCCCGSWYTCIDAWQSCRDLCGW
jgi:hypothetical protein